MIERMDIEPKSRELSIVEKIVNSCLALLSLIKSVIGETPHHFYAIDLIALNSNVSTQFLIIKLV